VVKEIIDFYFEQFDLLVFGFEGIAQFLDDSDRILFSELLSNLLFRSQIKRRPDRSWLPRHPL